MLQSSKSQSELSLQKLLITHLDKKKEIYVMQTKFLSSLTLII